MFFYFFVVVVVGLMIKSNLNCLRQSLNKIQQNFVVLIDKHANRQTDRRMNNLRFVCKINEFHARVHMKINFDKTMKKKKQKNNNKPQNLFKF